MKKQAIIATFLMLCLFAIVSTAGAAEQYGQYGGNGESTSIMVDKLIAVPHDNKGAVTYTYVDNLSRTDYKFKTGNYIFFKIKVQNTSNKVLNSVVVEDTFPQYLEIFDYGYTFDKNSRKLTVNVGSLKVGEAKEFTLKARVLPIDQLPKDSGLFCIVNNVKAISGSVSDTDNAQLCIEKQVLGGVTTPTPTTPVTEIPKTGAEIPMLLGLSGALGYIGLKLRKFNNK